MKASEIIVALQELIKQHGDLDVISYEVVQSDYYHSTLVPVAGVFFSPKGTSDGFYHHEDSFILKSRVHKYNC